MRNESTANEYLSLQALQRAEELQRWARLATPSPRRAAVRRSIFATVLALFR